MKKKVIIISSLVSAGILAKQLAALISGLILFYLVIPCGWLFVEEAAFMKDAYYNVLYNNKPHRITECPFEPSFFLGKTKEEIIAKYGDPPNIVYLNMKKNRLPSGNRLPHKNHQELLYPLHPECVSGPYGICICLDESGVAHDFDLFAYDGRLWKDGI